MGVVTSHAPDCALWTVELTIKFMDLQLSIGQETANYMAL